VFLVDRQGVLRCAGRTHQHSVTEVEGPVVPAAVGNGLNREASPLRELVDDELMYLFRVDGNALGLGPRCGGLLNATPLSGTGNLKGETYPSQNDINARCSAARGVRP
jgi:hypothetical protein